MKDTVNYIEPSHEAMEWAVEKAQWTAGYFRESLQEPRPEQTQFSAKARIQDGTQTEDLWLVDLQIDEENNVFGTIKNAPEVVTNVQAGGRIGVGEEAMKDWMIVEDGRLIGGYTIRAVRNAMSPAQQEDFDEGLGLKIDEGVDHFPHDFRTPEGAILCLEDAFSAGDIDRAVACKDFPRESRHMLQRVPNLEVTDDIVASTAATLEMSFRSFFSEHGMPNFTGVDRAFTQREFEDEDTVVVTEFIRHPDGTLTADRIWVYCVDGEWKVGPPANEDL